jgi:4-hydroxybutyrate dehydrogenase
MFPVLPLPRLIFGTGSLSAVASELSLLGVRRPLLMSDQGLERAGLCASAVRWMPPTTLAYLRIPENPSAEDVDAAFRVYKDGACDGVVALGGGSVIDTAKMVAALACGEVFLAAELLGKPELIGLSTAPLIAIPTTVGTGSESSPVSAIHVYRDGPVIGTRSPRLVPRVAICDPDLVRTLPGRLVAATGIDALSHCLEGYFSEPENPIVDALALNGLALAFSNLRSAVKPTAENERASMMAAAFMGGAAIHKGLGPVHSIALACSDQGLHHGSLVAAALSRTVELIAKHVPGKADRIATALGLRGAAQISTALEELIVALGLPRSLAEAGYRAESVPDLVNLAMASPFNRSSPYVPTALEYEALLESLLT